VLGGNEHWSGEVSQEELIARMLNGASFTYGGMCSAYGDEVHESKTRLIDRTIQKLRRAGKIAYTREGRLVVWRPTEQPA
jgi:hypothetical protein